MIFSAQTWTALTCVATLALGFFWSRQIGIPRALGATACRILWLSPVLIALFPQMTSQELPRSLALTSVQVLLDDSASMNAKVPSGLPYSQRALEVLGGLKEECQKIGCELKVSKLSSLSPLTKLGYTPLSTTLEPWFNQVGQDPWLLVSDGGDFQPTVPWSESLRGHARGLIVGYERTAQENIWIEHTEVAPFAFEGKPIVANVLIQRVNNKSATSKTQTIQVQASLDGKVLATTSAFFAEGSNEAPTQLSIPALNRGSHLIVIKALPTAEEEVTWDNESYAQVEVMPNTVGVLHLLGAPSWDGRFLRRYLKSEPKYDLISFFILRDPWDSQTVDERELSLIPFPVDRLFNQELPNFRVIIIQNFTLWQFLQADYQRNLVNFVKNGGGLLFVGGDRALRDADIRNSPLREILPFSTNSTNGTATESNDEGSNFLAAMQDWEHPAIDKSGPWYDKDAGFAVQLAQPKPQERALANVYDDWENLQNVFSVFKRGKGLHHMERVHFKEGSFTPLLNAKLPASNQEIPLAVASYPGKGRAIWIFSDSLWRLALYPDQAISREAYTNFFDAAMTWLVRQDLRKPLLARNLVLHSQQGERSAELGKTQWRVSLQGPAVPYFDRSANWQVTLCQSVIALSDVNLETTGNQAMTLSGTLPQELGANELCTFQIRGSHVAFGSVESSTSTLVPQKYKDENLLAAPQKLKQLSALTGAQLLLLPNGGRQTPLAALEWLDKQTGQDGIALNQHFQRQPEYYWHLDKAWLWLLLLFMPLEVLIRRWPALMGGSGKEQDTFASKSRAAPR